jgi:hypothetical protein
MPDARNPTPNSDRLLDAAEILIEQGLRLDAYGVLQLVSDASPTAEQRSRILALARLALARRRGRIRPRLEDVDDLELPTC